MAMMSGMASQCSMPKLRPVRPYAGYHFVDDHQDVVAVADCADGGEVVGRWHQAAARSARDRLGDKGGDGLAALLFDDSFQFFGTGERTGGLIFTVRAVIRVGEGDVREVEQIRHVVFAPRGAARHGKRADGVAVPALPAGDDLVLLGVAGLDVVLAGDLERGLGGFGPAGDEEHAVEVAGGYGGDLVGEVDLRLGEEAGIGKADLVGLLPHDLSYLRDAVADGDDVDAGAGIEVGAAVFGVEIAVFAVGNLRPVVGNDAVENAVGGHGAAVLSGWR